MQPSSHQPLFGPPKECPPVAPRMRWREEARGFSLLEVVIALAVVSIGMLGTFGMVLQSGKMVSAAEEDALVWDGIEQRVDQLRELQWGELTDGTGITTKVWTARPVSMAGVAVTQETLTLSPYDVAAAKTLTATWNGVASPTVTFGAGAQTLDTASAVKVVATLTWTGRRSSRQQTRSVVSVISRGGISKSAL